MAVGVRAPLGKGAAVALVLVAGYCLVQWGDSSSPEPAAAPADDSSARSGAGDAQAGRASRPAAPRAPARPVAISVAAIDVSSTLVGLGLNDDGTVEVPTDPDRAGWYRLGTRPGAPGSAVILGHVDSADGPAVFARLDTLRRGNLVRVRLADGSTARFRVVSVRVYANARFPARRIYAAADGRTLNLVTCGGEYDASRGGYQANVVVHARWVSTRDG